MLLDATRAAFAGLRAVSRDARAAAAPSSTLGPPRRGLSLRTSFHPHDVSRPGRGTLAHSRRVSAANSKGTPPAFSSMSSLLTPSQDRCYTGSLCGEHHRSQIRRGPCHRPALDSHEQCCYFVRRYHAADISRSPRSRAASQVARCVIGGLVL